jgi:hypothetical protein
MWWNCMWFGLQQRGWCAKVLVMTETRETGDQR